MLAVCSLAVSARAAEAELKVAVGPDAEQERALAHGADDDEAAADDEDDLPVTSRTGTAAGVRGGFGVAHARGLALGWYARLEMEAMTTQQHEGAGLVGGALIGGEYWSSEDGSGGGLPMGFFLGLRSPFLFTSLGGGFQLFIVDNVRDDGGFGLYAPFASFVLGVELAGVRIAAETRGTYRWQWGAPDRALATAGLSLAIFDERLYTRRPRPARDRRDRPR